MKLKYYLDTAIYLDYYFGRKERFRPIGDWAYGLLSLIIKEKSTIVMSDFLLMELETHLQKHEIEAILKPFQDIIENVKYSNKQMQEAKLLARNRNLPKGDALHAVLARDSNAVMVTRDRHFEMLTDIVVIKKPEDII